MPAETATKLIPHDDPLIPRIIVGADKDAQLAIDKALTRELARQTPNRLRVIAHAMRHGFSDDEIFDITKFDPWFLARIPRDRRRRGRDRDERPAGDRGRPAPGEDDGLHRRAAGNADGPRRGPGEACSAEPRRHRRFQAHRHLCGRIRGADALYVFDLRGRCRRLCRMRGAAHRPEEDRDPRRWAEPDRSGDRVRLLLLSCLLRADGGRVRDHHGQLQPRDRVDRLRHPRTGSISNH